MKGPIRNAAAVVAIGLLGCATVAVIRATNPSAKGIEPVSQESNAGRGNDSNSDGPAGRSGGEADTSREGKPSQSTKPKERPSEMILAQRRLKRHQLELVETLKRFRENHPAAVEAMTELKKLEAEVAAAGGGDRR